MIRGPVLGAWALGCAAALGAAPAWKAPERMAFGEMAVLELREADPGAPPLPRPPLEQDLGPLALRALAPDGDGRGWRLTVQALRPGRMLVPALDLGDGRRAPELRLEVPRSAPFGGLWMALGGGPANALPEIEFPLMWALLAGSPGLVLAAWAARLWRSGSARRARKRLEKRFARAARPRDPDRAALDALHGIGRDLLAARFGEAARAWGPKELRTRRLAPWAEWCEALDGARFSGRRFEAPETETLLRTLAKAPE